MPNRSFYATRSADGCNGAVAGIGVDLSVVQEIERIKQSIRKVKQAIQVEYGGLNPAIHRCAVLKNLPTAAGTKR